MCQTDDSDLELRVEMFLYVYGTLTDEELARDGDYFRESAVELLKETFGICAVGVTVLKPEDC